MPSWSNQSVIEELLPLLSARGILLKNGGEDRLEEEGFVGIFGFECSIPNKRSPHQFNVNINTKWFVEPCNDLSKPTKKSWGQFPEELDIDIYLFPITPNLFALHYLELRSYALQLEEDRESWFNERRWGLEIDDKTSECCWLHNEKRFPIHKIDASSDIESISIDIFPKAIDIAEPEQVNRYVCQQSRIIRDTNLTLSLKHLYNFHCQICGVALQFDDGQKYAESHHLKPLGKDHNGPDALENMICVCPNHHALLDYGGMRIDPNAFSLALKHNINNEYIEYHNHELYRGV